MWHDLSTNSSELNSSHTLTGCIRRTNWSINRRRRPVAPLLSQNTIVTTITNMGDIKVCMCVFPERKYIILQWLSWVNSIINLYHIPINSSIRWKKRCDSRENYYYSVQWIRQGCSSIRYNDDRTKTCSIK